jgi:hypothetical protein
VIHPLAAHRTEACDYGAAWAVSFSRMASSIWAHNPLSHRCSRIVATLGDLTQRAAHTDRLIDGGSGAAAQTAQHESVRAERIVHGTSARTAGPAGHSRLTSRTVMTHVDAIEPRLVEEFTGLHMEADRDRFFAAHCVGRRPAATSATKIDVNGLVRNANQATPIIVTIPILIIMTIAVLITIAILAGVLRRGKRTESREK